MNLDNLHIVLSSRRNTTQLWQTPDSLEQYKETTKFGKNLYKPGDFTYSFNEYGFRCDSFNLNSDISIVFAGCSNTEGVGLPLEEVWAYKLLEKIRKHTNKTIPYWNIGFGGAGLDTIAANLYEFNKLHKIDYIFLYLPGTDRREYMSDLKYRKMWSSSFSDNTKNSIINDIFSDK